MQFIEFLNLAEAAVKFKAVCLEGNFDWVKQISLPSINLGLPSVEKKSKIVLLSDKTNPIYIQLADGSKLFFTYDEFRRIQGKPEVGRELKVLLQRLGTDKSVSPSKITMCKVTS